MNHSKEKNSAKKGFERKLVNGKNNPKYVDLLEEDKPIAGQKFVCVSFYLLKILLNKSNCSFLKNS